MKCLEKEFDKGDIVTFRAYKDQNIKAKVIDSLLDGGHWVYKLEGISESLISMTSGISIKESKYFKCPIKHPFKW